MYIAESKDGLFIYVAATFHASVEITESLSSCIFLYAQESTVLLL